MSLLAVPYNALSYNGFTFPVSTETVNMSIRPIYDASGRTVIYSHFSLVVRAIIATASIGTTASAILAFRQLLTKPGGKLIYDGRGFGGFTINLPGGGGVRDVVWGPKPQMLSFKPLGGPGLAAEITWQVDVGIPDCDSASYQFRPLEFAFSVSYDLHKGYTKRTIQGFLRVPMSRRNAADRTLPDSVDLYRERINPPLLPGFDRSFGPWTIDESKTRLDWSIIDEELGGPAPPPNVVTPFPMSHTVSSSEKGLTLWTGHVTAEYELTKFSSPLVAIKHFLTLARDRIQATAQQVGKAANAILPIHFSMTEPDIFGLNKARFTLGYTFVSPLKSILLASSLWRPVGGDWRLWALSLQDTVFSPRGYAQLSFEPGDDRLIDLCDSAPVVNDLTGGHGGIGSLPRDTGAVAFPGIGAVGGAVAAQATELVAATFPRPNPGTSWIYYESELWLETDQANTPVRPLPTTTLAEGILRAGVGLTPFSPIGFDPLNLTSLPLSQGIAGGVASLGQRVGALLTTGRIPRDLEQGTHRRTAPAVYIFLRGRAARAGVPVPIPTLRDVGGIKPVPASRLDRNEGYSQGIKAGTGAPLYTATWNLRYHLPKLPAVLPIPPNPILGAV